MYLVSLNRLWRVLPPCRNYAMVIDKNLKPLALEKDIKRWQAKHKKEIKRLLRENQISEALNYYYGEVKVPSVEMYSIMLSAVGKTGHTALAFQLLRDMRARDMRPTPAILTCLFNSCAMNTENRKLALNKAKSLYEQMKEKGWTPSNITYHSMIKAFAMHGDTATCFKLLDEMIAARHVISVDTYTHLLMACVGDKNTGFVLAMRVMRLMLWQRIKPSVYSYNLLLQAAVECGCGDNVDILNKLLTDARQTQMKDPKVALISDGTSLLDVRLSDSIISVSSVPENVKDKIQLIGGIKGLLDQMSYFKIQPSARTYSMLVNCITDEDELLAFVRSLNPKELDTGFWNQLLKKCIISKYKCVDEVKELLQNSGCQFDILTYGILAMAVHKPDDVNIFLAELDEKELPLNDVIMSTLINNMSRKYHYSTVISLLRLCIDNEIALNEKAIKIISLSLERSHKAGAVAKIERLLSKITVINETGQSRLKQFEPEIRRRDRKKWDPENENDDETLPVEAWSR